jgi:hypothetical protein
VFTPPIDRAAGALDVTEEPRKADVIVILGESQFVQAAILMRRVSSPPANPASMLASPVHGTDSQRSDPSCVKLQACSHVDLKAPRAKRSRTE